MPRTVHDFSISQDSSNPPGGTVGAFIIRTNAEVEILSARSGFELWPHTPDHLRLVIRADENDPRLRRLYDALWELYHLKPSPRSVIPIDERGLYFGVWRIVAWTKKELDACELLWLRNKLIIATHANATAEQLERETYVAELDHRQRSGTQFGNLMPFTALAVAEPLRAQLLAAELSGLSLPAVRIHSAEPEDYQAALGPQK